jgi:NADPH:quinone reductase
MNYSMKAVIMTAPGTADVLQLQERPRPSLRQDSDILVRLKAAGVNPIDTKLRQRGTFYPGQMPAILGCDAAGIVEAIAPQVTRFQVGDEVYFCNGGLGGNGELLKNSELSKNSELVAQAGNYAEYAVVNERFAAHRPRTQSFAVAAAAPLVLITAWEALYDRGRLQSGQSVLIQAGAGGVGHVAIQLAKQVGAKVCTTVSTPEKAAFVKQLGADEVILYPQTDVVKAVMDWTNGVGVDLGFDTIGGSILSQTIACTKVYGDVVSILAPDSETNWKLVRDRNQRVGFELMLTPMVQGMVLAQEAQARILEQCSRLMDQQRLMVHIGATFPLAAAADAHRTLEAGSMMGKIVLMV